MKIWKNELYDGEAYSIVCDAVSGTSIELPAGTYQAYVDAINYYQCLMSNVVTFTVEEDIYNITYNPNGGENAPANQTKKYDEDITLSSTKPTRDGYVFLGWSTDSDSDIIDYFPGDTYSENKDITLYAVWKKNIYIEGNLKTFGESTDDIVFTFVSDDEYENTYIVPIDGDASVYSIMGINPGKYNLLVSKENHVSAEYYVDLTADATLDIQLNLIGDINGDGKINVMDYSSVLRHAKKTENLEDYAFLCADVDGNGRVTVSDYARILRHVKKTDPLW